MSMDTADLQKIMRDNPTKGYFKRAKYYGKVYIVPSWTVGMAFDLVGNIYAFSANAVANKEGGWMTSGFSERVFNTVKPVVNNNYAKTLKDVCAVKL